MFNLLLLILYHCNHNPIELICHLVKKKIAAEMSALFPSHLSRKLPEDLSMKWQKKIHGFVKALEDEYWRW